MSFSTLLDLKHLAADGRKVSFGFVLSDEFSLLAFSAFIEVLRQMNDHGRAIGREFCDWHVLGADAGNIVFSSSGIAVTTTLRYVDVGALDFIVVVGGRRSSTLSEAAQSFLRRTANESIIVALDTGTFALARLHLFEARRFCIHWIHYHEFVDEFPHLRASMDAIFLEEGAFISCAGGTWAADLAVYLVTQLWAQSHAQRVISIMGLERLRAASHYQLPFYEGPIVNDTRVQRAIQLIERRSNQPPTHAELAREAGLSERQLDRRFVTALGMAPLEFSRVLRLRFAHSLLARSRRSIAQIAADCGFADQSHLTRHFRSLFGVTPRRLRTQQPQGDSASERAPP